MGSEQEVCPLFQSFGKSAEDALRRGMEQGTLHTALPSDGLRPQILKLAEEKGTSVESIVRIGEKLLWIAFENKWILTENLEIALFALGEIADDPE